MSLSHKIIKELQDKGPMPIDRYLELCLYDNNDGYYFTQNVIGHDGDFITSPEITQIFGELIALFIIDEWQKAGAPINVNIIECGPGRGTLISDMMRIFKKFPVFSNTLRIHLLEKSRPLRHIQKQCLNEYNNIFWYDDIFDIPYFDDYTFTIANEFFDALPIKQYIVREGEQIERHVILNDSQKIDFSQKDNSDIFEYCDGYVKIINNINDRLKKASGGVLIIDYGDFQDNRLGSTLQGMKNHAYASIFETPGHVDISHQVNFKAVSELFLKEIKQSPLMTQGSFLESLGINIRMEQLLKGATPEQRMQIITACARLVSPQHMGNLFKVLYACSHD